MKVADYMTREVVTANLRDGLHQTFHRMRERNVRHLPVVDGEGLVVGIISDRDIRRPDFVDFGPNVTGYYRLDNTVKVADAMSSRPVTISAQTPVGEALDLFLTHRFGALPVTDDGRLVGILSNVDLLRAFRDHLGD